MDATKNTPSVGGSDDRAPLAIVTMVYDEPDYLRIWLEYWRQQVPGDQLFVLIHGENAQLAAMAEGTNIVVIPRSEPYPEMEEDRWKMLSEFVSGLLDRFRVAVYTDVDEILVTDPLLGKDIATRLAAAKAPVSHACGIEIIHRGDLEPDPIDLSRPILQQRGFFRTNTFHGKPCIITAPIRWGRGGHFHDKRGVRFLPHVYAIHLRFYDETCFLERAARRRKTTKAPKSLDANPSRRWRQSDAAAQDLLNALRATPIRPFGMIMVLWSYLRVLAKRGSRPLENGFYPYPRYPAPRLHAVPKRFKTLF
ncbi:hypothetical protein So717_42400 [Roseobacter cerasinus]|uniref:Glycosyl transferase family 2 n=2 Tax=Roseobacter cerasinus TaxID=2602289 RepID=A0A640VX55_9RHOB|nr:hypothetical protein So717_42400 [Roseobacter cerasinus]